MEKALKKYREVWAKNPANLGVAMLIATLLEQQGRPREAKAIYEKILDRNPNVSAAANNLAFYYAEYEPTTQNLMRAKALVGPLLDRHKDNPNVMDTAAWIAYRQGEFKKARDLMAGMEEKSKNIPVINYHLGMIYLRLDRKALARKYLSRALKGKDRYPGRKEAEKAYKQLT